MKVGVYLIAVIDVTNHWWNCKKLADYDTMLVSQPILETKYIKRWKEGSN